MRKIVREFQGENRQLKEKLTKANIKFRFPVLYNGIETEELRWDKESTVETVCLRCLRISRQGILTHISMQCTRENLRCAKFYEIIVASVFAKSNADACKNLEHLVNEVKNLFL